MKANKEQLQAINSNSDRILCLAAAGSGKTKSLVGRVSRLVADGVDPASILSLTFTNAAAAEMRERYEKQNPDKEVPEFRTFHAFCYSILCKDPNIRIALGYDNIPEIASDVQIKELEEKAKLQCKTTLTKDQLLHRENLTKKEQFQAELYDKALLRLMRFENLITFDRLNSDVSALFASNNPVTQKYKDKYCYIFVDEYQDTDGIQMQFLNSFPNSNFYLTGDTLQNLYSFRGTSNEYIKMLSNAPDWEKVRLYINYRSTDQICEYANEFSEKYADPSYWVKMQGTRDGEKVKTKYVSGPTKYQAINPDSIVDVLKELESLSGSSAILCRTNKEVYAVTSYLKEQNIEFNSSKESELPQLIECALSETYMMNWLASFLNSNKYGEYIRLSAQVDTPDLAWFLRLYGRSSQIKEYVSLVKQLQDISVTTKPISEKLAEIADVFKLSSIEVPDADYFGEDFLNYLKSQISKKLSTNLYVGTIHSSKGLEYDNVFVMNVGSYSFRLETEEMKNLFYVAITRARNRLFVYKLFES